ncbi:hypothetical protein [Paraburkholderia aromaticivorans]|uniref:Uncharacterized protein n=1 Tax=Paraburkholderia aromaticivorans TaxID=2026199 RepID=A0A248VQ94_9BURK|nr:hypothetical protein [Paraburkholderia aromaticivorans]ASW01045.1 hypothetical protein CJU94_22815 [Paraburkholderia aromaticivorans]
MTLLASWRSVSGSLAGRTGRLRGIAIAVIAIGAAAGSAMAADRFAAASGGESSVIARPGSMPICGRFIR